MDIIFEGFLFTPSFFSGFDFMFLIYQEKNHKNYYSFP